MSSDDLLTGRQIKYRRAVIFKTIRLMKLSPMGVFAQGSDWAGVFIPSDKGTNELISGLRYPTEEERDDFDEVEVTVEDIKEALKLQETQTVNEEVVEEFIEAARVDIDDSLEGYAIA